MDQQQNERMNQVHRLLDCAEMSVLYHNVEQAQSVIKQCFVPKGNRRDDLAERIIWHGVILSEQGKDIGTFTFSLPEALLQE